MQYSHRDWYIKWGQVNFKRDFDLIKKRARVKKGTFHDLRRTAICDCFVQGMTEYDVMKLAGYSEFSTTYKYYLAVRDDLIDKARPTTARGLCKKLAHFGAPPVSGAKEIDKVDKKSLYYQDLRTERP